MLGDDEEEDEIDQEMEITWTTGLEDNTGVMDEADKNEVRGQEGVLDGQWYQESWYHCLNNTILKVLGPIITTLFQERQSVATHYKPDDKDDFFATDEVVDRPKEKKKKTKKKKGMKEVETKEAAELALLMQVSLIK